MTEKKIRNFTYIISFMWLIAVIMSLGAYFGIESLDKAGVSFSTAVFGIAAPVYLILLSRYYRKYKIQKLSVKKSWKIILISLAAELVLTVVFAVIASSFTEGSENANLKDMDLNSVKSFIIITFTLLWSLAGEEGGKIAFFIFLDRIIPLSLFKNRNSIKYWICWIIDIMLFGILHLSAYEYDMIQCIVVIGAPSIIYGYIWKKTENPKVMWLVHFIYDFLLVSLVALGS